MILWIVAGAALLLGWLSGLPLLYTLIFVALTVLIAASLRRK